MSDSRDLNHLRDIVFEGRGVSNKLYSLKHLFRMVDMEMSSIDGKYELDIDKLFDYWNGRYGGSVEVKPVELISEEYNSISVKLGIVLGDILIFVDSNESNNRMMQEIYKYLKLVDLSVAVVKNGKYFLNNDEDVKCIYREAVGDGVFHYEGLNDSVCGLVCFKNINYADFLRVEEIKNVNNKLKSDYEALIRDERLLLKQKKDMFVEKYKLKHVSNLLIRLKHIKKYVDLCKELETRLIFQMLEDEELLFVHFQNIFKDIDFDEYNSIINNFVGTLGLYYAGPKSPNW